MAAVSESDKRRMTGGNSCAWKPGESERNVDRLRISLAFKVYSMGGLLTAVAAKSSGRGKSKRATIRPIVDLGC